MSILRLYSLDIYSEWELIMIEVFEEKEDTSNQEDSSQIESIEKEEEVREDEFLELSDAMKMADRSSKTIRNWIKDGTIEAKKENPENPKSKWLINKSSLMIHLATGVEADPPRRNTEEKEGKGRGLSDLKESESIWEEKQSTEQQSTVTWEEYKNLQLELDNVRKDNLKLQQTQQETQKNLELTQLRLEQKTEIIEMLKNNQPNLEHIFTSHERKVSDLLDQISVLQKELSIVRFAYDQELEKGVIARIFSPPTKLKLLETK